MKCKLFILTLKKATMAWFKNLEVQDSLQTYTLKCVRLNDYMHNCNSLIKYIKKKNIKQKKKKGCECSSHDSHFLVANQPISYVYILLKKSYNLLQYKICIIISSHLRVRIKSLVDFVFTSNTNSICCNQVDSINNL